ncbi:MAG: type II toxin-antitoxin system VapC family toxin [Chloroflexota bacterium]|nr:type II toxin-antitoxin system VapC family toxin [Chloroflexota bacterium]MDE2941135.1 type II toxin-antitoxin system VapC family toxin [Chloroflexota bacterium]MDE3267339.1 type II toxin-antitoxin system VapC family toxin [Chloroflexota bacterium]
MITAVDTNVLLDLFRTDSPFHSQSREWLRRAYNQGAVIVCDLVYAELVPAFASRASLDAALRDMGAALSPVDSSIAYEAGLRWKQYRSSGGTRERIITDFLIGAHAAAMANSFLTRDLGVYSAYFPELKVPEVS